MLTDFEILLVDRDELEFLAAEISFKGQRLCQIYREEIDGKRGNLVIEFLQDLYVIAHDVKMIMSLQNFNLVVEQAKNSIDAEPLLNT